jgi:hypothetical protein
MLGRLSEAKEYRGAALFALSDASSFMTGNSLIVDGGYTAVSHPHTLRQEACKVSFARKRNLFLLEIRLKLKWGRLIIVQQW